MTHAWPLLPEVLLSYLELPKFLSQPQFLFPAFGFHFVSGARRQRWQSEYNLEIVICRDSIEAFDTAAEAAMYEDIFAVSALETANRLHSAAAGTSAISYLPVIDVT